MGRDRYPRQALGTLYGRIKQVRYPPYVRDYR